MSSRCGCGVTGGARATVYNTLRVVLDLWDHAADDPESFGEVPTPPRNREKVLPRPPVYSAPPAPTLAECDACIRHIPAQAYVALGVAIIRSVHGAADGADPGVGG